MGRKKNNTKQSTEEKKESITEIFKTKEIHKEPEPFKKVKLSESWGKR